MSTFIYWKWSKASVIQSSLIKTFIKKNSPKLHTFLIEDFYFHSNNDKKSVFTISLNLLCTQYISGSYSGVLVVYQYISILASANKQDLNMKSLRIRVTFCHNCIHILNPVIMFCLRDSIGTGSERLCRTWCHWGLSSNGTSWVAYGIERKVRLV